jgi:hypothetical protein
MPTATAEIIYKFQELRAKAALIFDAGKLHYKFMKQELFEEEFNPFYESLEPAIRTLPKIDITFDEIDEFVNALSRGILRIKKKSGKTEIDAIHLRYRLKLKAKLLEIKSSLNKDRMDVGVRSPGKTELINEAESTLLLFRDIFISPDWELYIGALSQVTNPVISNPPYKFTGKSQKHKGVICSWIKELQHRGIISNQYNRQQLASVLNREIKDLNLGKDGKTFDNISLVYDNHYRTALLRLTNLLP